MNIRSGLAVIITISVPFVTSALSAGGILDSMGFGSARDCAICSLVKNGFTRGPMSTVHKTNFLQTLSDDTTKPKEEDKDDKKPEDNGLPKAPEDKNKDKQYKVADSKVDVCNNFQQFYCFAFSKNDNIKKYLTGDPQIEFKDYADMTYVVVPPSVKLFPYDFYTISKEGKYKSFLGVPDPLNLNKANIKDGSCILQQPHMDATKNSYIEGEFRGCVALDQIWSNCLIKNVPDPRAFRVPHGGEDKYGVGVLSKVYIYHSNVKQAKDAKEMQFGTADCKDKK
jgi:hypothetical protein